MVIDYWGLEVNAMTHPVIMMTPIVMSCITEGGLLGNVVNECSSD